MAELRDLHSRVGDGDGAALLEALEEPLLHGVVVQRPINVHGSDGRPGRALALQQRLRVQLPFVPALGVHGVHLPTINKARVNFSQSVLYPSQSHEDLCFE